MFLHPSTGETKESSLFLYSVCTELSFALNASRFGLLLPCMADGPLTDIHQASTLINRPDASPHNSDLFALPSDTLLEHGDSEPFEGLNGSPLDSDETAFMDLFTESESSQDTAKMVRECLIPTAHLTRNLGCVACNFHTRAFSLNSNISDDTARNVSYKRNS